MEVAASCWGDEGRQGRGKDERVCGLTFGSVFISTDQCSILILAVDSDPLDSLSLTLPSPEILTLNFLPDEGATTKS